MITVLLYTTISTVFGLILGALYGYWLGEMSSYGLVGLLVGLLIGATVGVGKSVFGASDYVFDYNRLSHTAYKLAPCAWCKKTGKVFLVLRCKVCRGCGAVLTTFPRWRCAWCRGKGTEYGILSCRVCDGSGWAYAHQDRMEI